MSALFESPLPLPLSLTAEPTVAESAREKTERLYRRYAPVIFQRCRRLLDDEAEARDLTQETFLRLQRHFESSSDTRHDLALIYRTATNLCLNELQRRKRHATPVGEALAELGDRLGGDKELESRLGDRQLLKRIVLEAPEKLSVPAWLRHADGLTNEEIARVLEVTPRTVINRLSDFEAFARKLLSRWS